MRIEAVTNYDNKLSFRSVKFSPNELKRADAVIRQISASKTDDTGVNKLYNKLFNIFFPHLKEESRIRAGRFYIADEIFSEIALKLAELIKNINLNTKTADIIREINKYKPSKYAYKPETVFVSLNSPQYRRTPNIQKLDYVTQDNLPVPESEITIERYHKLLDGLIADSNLSITQEKRLRAKASGKTIAAISKAENVSTQVVKSSVNKSILKIQDKSGVLSESTKEKIETLANILGCSFSSLKKTILIRPDLLYYKPETLLKNIKTSSELLECPEKKFLKYALKYPALIYQKPETILKNIDDVAEILHCTSSEYRHAALIHPELLCRSAKSLKRNIQGSAAVLNCPEEDMIKTALKHPQIFCKKPETLLNNTKLFSQLFNVPFDDARNILMKYPTLFYRDLVKIRARVRENALALEIGEANFMKTALKSPILLCLNPEKILRNYNIMNYYRKLQNMESKCLSPILSDEMWYVKMLTILINKQENANVIVHRNVTVSSLEKYIKEHPDISYNFEIPEGFCTEELVDFARRISEKSVGKNIFNIKITNQVA